MKEKPRKPGKRPFFVHTEEGLDRIAADLERRQAAGETLPTAEKIKRERDEVHKRQYDEFLQKQTRRGR
jgi:hypothetical protein